MCQYCMRLKELRDSDLKTYVDVCKRHQRYEARLLACLKWSLPILEAVYDANLDIVDLDNVYDVIGKLYKEIEREVI